MGLQAVGVERFLRAERSSAVGTHRLDLVVFDVWHVEGKGAYLNWVSLPDYGSFGASCRVTGLPGRFGTLTSPRATATWAST